jgi:adenylate cyclase class 2
VKYEVEFKFRVRDLAAQREKLTALGARTLGVRRQIDRYFNHPARNFAETDEALRIRSDGDRNWITYKGPKVDSVSKTRNEIELPIGPGAETLAKMAELLESLGFREVGTVDKTREIFEMSESQTKIEAALDEVAGLGSFVELEASADEASLDAVRRTVAGFAEKLSLTAPERRSYLELILERRQP